MLPIVLFLGQQSTVAQAKEKLEWRTGHECQCLWQLVSLLAISAWPLVSFFSVSAAVLEWCGDLKRSSQRKTFLSLVVPLLRFSSGQQFPACATSINLFALKESADPGIDEERLLDLS